MSMIKSPLACRADVCNAVQEVYMDDSMSTATDGSEGSIQLLPKNTRTKQGQR